MSGKVMTRDGAWFWREEGRGDLKLRHNEWAKTPAEQDMPRLAAPLARLAHHEAAAKTAIADSYYQTWQDGWRRDGDPALSREDFMATLTLMSVSYPSAQHLHSHFELSFDDGGLFAGHAFFATFTLDGVLAGVEMFG